MKKFILMFVFLGFSVQFLFAQWSQITNAKLEGGEVEGYVNVGTSVLAYTNHGGIFKSADSGKTWVYSGYGLDTFSNRVRELVYFNSTLYALMDNQTKIYTSTNNGATWTVKTNFTGFASNTSLMTIGANSTRCFALVHHQNLNDSVFLYYSSNGTAFTQGPLVRINNNWENELISDNLSKCYIQFYGSSGNQILYTTDGTSLTTISLSGLPSTNFDISTEKTGDHLYAVCDGGYYKYNFGTQSWNNIKNSSLPLTSQAMNFNATDIALFAAVLDFVPYLTIKYFRSLNRGSSWQEMTNSGMTIPIIDRLVQVAGGNMVCNSDFGDCYYSSDTGRTWKTGNSGLRAKEIVSLESLSGKLFTTTNDIDGVMMSDDQGANWQYKNNGLPQMMPNMVWSEGMFKVGNSLFNIVYKDPMTDSLFIYKSNDEGNNWSQITTPNAVHFSVYGKQGNNVIIRTGPSEPDYNEDLYGTFYLFNGTNWTLMNTNPGPIKKIYSFCGNGSTLYMFARRPSDLECIYSSTNNGTSWTQVYQAVNYNYSLKTLENNNVNKVISEMVPSSQSVLMVFRSWNFNSTVDSVFKLTGTTFSHIGYTGLPYNMNILNISYVNGVCLLTTTAGVFASINLTTWEKMKGNNFYPGVEATLLTPHNGDLFLGTLGNGMWKASGAGIDAGKDVTICVGDSTKLTATGADSNFTWCCGLGKNKSVWVKPASGTTSYVASAINTFGFTVTDTVKVTVLQKPTANFTIDKATQCPTSDNLFKFTNTSTNATTYLWDFGDKVTSTQTNPNHSYTNYITYGVKLKAMASETCFDTIIKNISFHTLPPAVVTAGGPITFCDGSSVTLYANTGTGLTYQWLKAGNPISGANNPFLIVNNANTYSVKVTDQATSCTDSSESTTTVVNSRDFDLSFTAAPRFFTSPPFNVAFDNLTPSIANYDFTWYFGDNTTATTAQAFHSYLFNGLFTVDLVAKHKTTGCFDTIKKADYISCSGGSTNPCTLNPNLKYPGTSTLICNGDSLKLMADTGWNFIYIWTFNGNVINGANKAFYYAKNGGEYRAMITSPVCSLTTYPLIVSVYSTNKPVIQTAGKLNPCANDSMQLFVTTFYPAYKWSTGATTNSIYIKNSGQYTLTITDAYGCKVTSDPVSINKSLLSPPQICIVTVEPSLKKNLIAWERSTTQLIDYYNVYKETFQADEYELIGSVDYDSLSVLVDTASIPGQRANRYRLTLVDTCGVESAPSNVHKTIHLSANKGAGNEINLIWSHYEGLNFSSYKIYRGTKANDLVLLDSIASNLNSYTDLNPPTGVVYYMVSIIKKDTCFPAIIRAQTNSGPFSQSISNIKDYNISGTQYLETSPSSLTFDSISGNTFIDIFTNVTGGWSSSSDQTWLTLTDNTVDNKIKVDYTANNTGSNRTATITITATGISDVTVPVVQKGSSSIIDYVKSSVLIYPNPAKDAINLQVPIHSSPMNSVEVLDITGKVVKSYPNISLYSMKISRDDLSKGLYMLRITRNEQIEVTKVFFE